MNNQISAENLQPISHDGVKVITSELLAQLYGTDAARIRKNHNRNMDRFIEGKHFYKVIGSELDNLRVSLRHSQNQSADLRVALNYSQNQPADFKHSMSLRPSVEISPKARSLILWTERGAARHAKMLETDQAWEVFEKLEDFYFTKGEAARERGQESAPATQAEIDAYYAASTARQLNMIRQVWDNELKHLLISIRSPIYHSLSSRIPDACILAEKSSSRLLAQLPEGAVPKLY